MDILWSLVFIHYITFKLKNLYFLFLLFVLIWCRSGEIMVGQADFFCPPDRLSCKVWETFVNSAQFNNTLQDILQKRLKILKELQRVYKCSLSTHKKN